ncbi:MAG: hypothetical protein V3V05_05090 [Pontiella sp.]
MPKLKPLQLNLIGLLVVALGTVLVWLLLGRPTTGIDDADIFFVYARNFSAGHGFVYNVGGEAVEGFTSMLWTLLCSGFARIFQSLEIPLILLNVVLGAVTLGACLRRTEIPLIYILILVAAPAWFAWCQVTLMESGLWCLLITLLTLAVAEQRHNTVLLLLPLLAITRPESMLWGAWLVLVFSMGKNWKSSLLPFGVLGLSVLALVGFRLWYFGYPVPNTYYAKVSLNGVENIRNGLGYLLNYLTSNVVVLAAAIFWLVVLVRGLVRGKTNPDVRTRIALCLLPGIGIPVLVGGDHFGAARFYQPIWPLLCLLAVGEWDVFSTRMRREMKWALPCVVLLLSWLIFPFTAQLKHEFRIAKEGRETGTALAEMFQDLERLPSVAVITAGGNKLTYSGTVLDLMGLNSTEMAHATGSRSGYKNHSGFNREVFYRWNPDIVLGGDSAEFDSLVLNGLHDEPRFSVMYTKSTLHRNGAEVQAYFRNEFLMLLPSRGRGAID